PLCHRRRQGRRGGTAGDFWRGRGRPRSSDRHRRRPVGQMTRTTPPTLPANPLEAIQLLRKVRDQLKESDASEIADAFATMLANYEATGGAEPLDRAFRLVPACGQEGWAA